MGVSIAWSAELETGIDIIDQQHQRLFGYFEEIEQCIATGDSAAVEQLCRGLIDYAISHNSFEESLMEKAGYPMHDAHHRVHEGFKTRAEGYLRRIDGGAEPLKVAREMRTDIGLWLINHIKHEDQHYAACVKKSLDRGLMARMLGKFFH
ncbi:bacteriohemerythrin [Pseudomonas sp. 5P_3.1_Bac2]|uniref:bacteriohemerythrin n=1 Tax=Pseudomonas sp. 5P_3.1_Bac2 TaxID=2971617 RepID=UPI0021C7D48A|nr:bacteriohemerythrin [Pseudomonas sp. 5P_3.1_Bac2]MCU1716077.1 bacteriohemerythrin [Pseudomonas sp. 5P_3.1_Bac2]